MPTARRKARDALDAAIRAFLSEPAAVACVNVVADTAKVD